MPLKLRQGQVDVGGLVARIRSEFPDLTFDRTALNDDGEDHAVVILDDTWVFRFPRADETGSYAAGERRLLEALRRVSPLPIPDYRWISTTGDFAGYPMIPGRALSERLFARLPGAVQERVCEEIGGFLAGLHQLPASLISSSGGATRATWNGADYARRYQVRRARFAAGLPRELLIRLDRFFESFPQVVDQAPRVLIHGDLSEDHILLAPGADRLGGVIDFTDAGVGDPAFDFTFLWAYGDWATARAAQVYGDADLTAAIVARSRWWFVRYSVDRLWWNLSDVRVCDTAKVEGDVRRSLEALGF